MDRESREGSGATCTPLPQDPEGGGVVGRKGVWGMGEPLQPPCAKLGGAAKSIRRGAVYCTCIRDPNSSSVSLTEVKYSRLLSGSATMVLPPGVHPAGHTCRAPLTFHYFLDYNTGNPHRCQPEDHQSQGLAPKLLHAEQPYSCADVRHISYTKSYA